LTSVALATSERCGEAPPLGPAVAESGGFAAGTWATLDVSSLARAGGSVAIGISTTSPSSKTLASREDSARPRLVLAAEPAPTAVLPLRDLQYEVGALAAFQTAYHPSWGRAMAKSQPVPGNHEYGTAGAAGFFDYFNGAGVADGRAGSRGRGYHDFEIGSWHVVALDSNCLA